MTLASTLAWEALQDIVTVAGLPVPTRNDLRLAGFADSGTAGVKWKLSIADGDIRIMDTLMGGPSPVYQLAIDADIALMFEAEPTPARETVMAAAMETLSETLFPGGSPVTHAVFEALESGPSIERDRFIEQNAAPVEMLKVTVSMWVTATTPFG